MTKQSDSIKTGICMNAKIRVQLKEGFSVAPNQLLFRFTSGDNQDLFTEITILGIDSEAVDALISELYKIRAKL